MEKSLNETKDAFVGLGLSVEAVDKKLAKRAGKNGEILDIDGLKRTAQALSEMNDEFTYMKYIENIDFIKFGDGLEKEIIRVRNLMSKNPKFVYEGGVVTQPFGLDKLEQQLNNLKEFNGALEQTGLNTIKYSKEAFDALNVDLSPFESAVNAFIATNNELSKLKVAEISTENLGAEMVMFVSIAKMLGGEDKTLQEWINWFNEFNSGASSAEERLKYMNKSMNDVLSTMNGLDLKSGTGLTIFIEKQGELDLLSGYSDDISGLISQTQTFGNQIVNEFASIGDGISSIMTNSFSEIFLSGRVAMQELEKYNKGLTNDFRTAAEIREDSWSNMWNNILTDTTRALLGILIKYTILTAALLALDAISGGLLRGAINVSESVGGFWGGMADFFKSAGGEGFAKIFGKSLNDGVITPSGQVIKTAPDDYIMAMKDPVSFGKNVGGGMGETNIHLHIDAVDGTSIERLFMRYPNQLASGIVNTIQSKALKLDVVGNRVGAKY
jgi:hypothetical protein